MFHRFTDSVSGTSLPRLFTFPFYYEPHPLAIKAAYEVQQYLTYQTDFEHNFGLADESKGLIIGKMFGVMVVQNANGDVGYIAAFSGKLADSNNHPFFVPPVFDMLTLDGYFRVEEAYLVSLTKQIEAFENDAQYTTALKQKHSVEAEALEDILRYKEKIKVQKHQRKEKRHALLIENRSNPKLEQELIEESKQEGIMLKKMKLYWQYRINEAIEACMKFETKIAELKSERKKKSGLLQQRLFDSYTFLNAKGESKSIGQLFDNNPPAGAGECSAPKLLQYAYKNDLRPIALAEFWWGQSPKSEVRKHQEFYPSCIGKCEPILSFMMQGLEVEPNPLRQNKATEKSLVFIYEDDSIIVINKPEDLPTVPGKNIDDSVLHRIEKLRPNLNGPIIVHRLDMATSGILILAKNKAAYDKLQRQFSQHRVKKEYVAVLEGILTAEEGIIELPLLPDYFDRPKQMVDTTCGKMAITFWKKESENDNTTRVRFFPKTGRTHQLRVHAAHKDGLNAPIVGDDLYGRKGKRLLLHAYKLGLKHPVTGESMEFTANPEF